MSLLAWIGIIVIRHQIRTAPCVFKGAWKSQGCHDDEAGTGLFCVWRFASCWAVTLLLRGHSLSFPSFFLSHRHTNTQSSIQSLGCSVALSAGQSMYISLLKSAGLKKIFFIFSRKEDFRKSILYKNKSKNHISLWATVFSPITLKFLSQTKSVS